MPTEMCRKCEAPLKPGGKFCPGCGTPVAPPPERTCPNPTCGSPLGSGDAFCSACGTRVEAAAGRPTAPPRKRVCTECAHFRVAVPISTLLRAPGKNAQEAITSISKDEAQFRDAEGTQKVELLKVGRMEWPTRPMMSNHCAARAAEGVFEIYELKNRTGDCRDFTPITPAPARVCVSCRFRRTHADPYAALDGVTTPETFRAMKDGIDAQIGLEVTAIYNAKGNHPDLPIAHEWCYHYSHTEGKAYVALPYRNRHNDCLAHEPNESAAIISPSRPRPMPRPHGRTATGVDDVTVIMSETVAAIRAAHEGEGDVLAETFIRHLEGIDDTGLRRHFELFTILMFKTRTHDPVFAAAARAVSEVLSAASIRLAENEAAFVRALDGNPFLAQSAYLLLGSLEGATNVAEMCAQTVKEAYWLDRIGIEGRRRFLDDERKRIRSGMYPQPVVGEVDRTVRDLARYQTKLESGVKTDPEADIKQACQFVTPLSVPQFVQMCEEQCNLARVANPFIAMPLDDEQQQAMTDLMSGDFDLSEAVAFLEDRHAALLEVIQTFWRVADPGHLPFDVSPYDRLTPLLSVIDIAHRFVTTLLNRYSRRLRGVAHVEFPHAPPSINNQNARQIFMKVEPTLGSALFPPLPSLDTLAHAAMVQASKPGAQPGARGKATGPKKQRTSHPPKREPTFEDLERMLEKEHSGPRKGTQEELDDLIEADLDEDEVVEEPVVAKRAATIETELTRQYRGIQAAGDPGKKRAAEFVFLATVGVIFKKRGIGEAKLHELVGTSDLLSASVTDELVEFLEGRELLDVGSGRRR